ncbi:hypothetical protein CC86DRAFT_413867 [Ophiobolus disseminans]|uniref:Uncharacterized protein n=1 Tax=Ophiobolus disseminans TaxID=1469910 RepID=A0A6A6ZE12_9PLEO|nr:hypothetical protein CC86DRAFT_413867 [Ophiobolus disseminans]
MIPPNHQNRTSQMAPGGVSGVGKRVGRDETPSRAPRSRPQRRPIPPPPPISPEASQLSEQGVPFSQPASVVQAALYRASDDDDKTDEEDLTEVVPPSGQREKTPTSRNLQYAHRRDPPRLLSEENKCTVVKFNACWRVYFTPVPGKPHKPLPGWKNSKSDTLQPLFRALEDWVKAVLAMQPAPMKQMDLIAVVYHQGQPHKERLVKSLYDVVDLQRHTRFAAAIELVQEVAYEHPESPVQMDFDLVLMPAPPVVHAPNPLPQSSNSTARQEAQLPARNVALVATEGPSNGVPMYWRCRNPHCLNVGLTCWVALRDREELPRRIKNHYKVSVDILTSWNRELLTAASTVTKPSLNIKAQLRKLREIGAEKRKRDSTSDTSEQLTQQLTQVT